MKHMWAVRKDREGVSPVIATILMVAITVVLAAVLYVMVLGFGGGGGAGITGSFTSQTSTSYAGQTARKLTLSSFIPDTGVTGIKVIVEIPGTTETFEFPSVGTTNPVVNKTGTNWQLLFYDLALNGILNSGDYFILGDEVTGGVQALQTGSYTVTILNAATGDQIDNITFTV